MIETFLRVDILLFLTIGLLGGAHCIGMCGPLVTTYAKRMSSRPDGASVARRDHRHAHLTPYEVWQHGLFNLGRTASYTILGAVCGALGGAVLMTTDALTVAIDPVRGLFGIVIGCAIVILGIRYAYGGAAAEVRLPGIDRVMRWVLSRVDRFVNSPGIVGLGALHGLFPCPILYPAYLFAFASGSALTGGIALAAIGIGTIPTVFLYGTIIESVGVVHRRRIHRFLGVVFILLGYILLAHGLMAVGISIPHPELPHYQPLGGASGGH